MHYILLSAAAIATVRSQHCFTRIPLIPVREGMGGLHRSRPHQAARLYDAQV